MKMMKIYNYTVTVKHDKGIKKLITYATCEDSAKQAIMNAEICPESAILKVKRGKRII